MAEPSESLEMTAPSVNRDLLIYDPSTRFFFVRAALPDSDPAKSMRLSIEIILSERLSALQDSMLTLQSVCDREDSLLKEVADTFL
jgi:hypothetical protein